MKTQLKLKLFFITCILILLIGSIVTFALFYDKQKTDPIKYQAGLLEFEVAGSLIDGYLVPGKNIIKQAYSITNYSSIDTEIRIKINFTLDNEPFSEFEEFNLNEKFYYNNEDNYYYYEEVIIPNEDNETIEIFSSLILDGRFVKNAFSNKNFTVNILFEAKQINGIDWTVLGTLNQ